MEKNDFKHLLTNPELARIVADITGDGHLQISGWRYLASFVSKHINEIESFEKRSEELFGVIPKRYIDSRKTHPGSGTRYQSFIISKPVALFLQEIGVPVGNKTNNPFKVPDFVYNGNLKMKRAYLRGLFDNEGTIYSNEYKRKIRWKIALKMAKNQNILEDGIVFFEQIRKMLSEFGVKTSTVNCNKLNIRKDGSQSINMRIAIELPSFRSFLMNIGFDHPEKSHKLKEAISTQNLPKSI
jgi:intein/homing endonuclease